MRRRLVLVLGAGASHPYGFPLGTQLLRHVLAPTPIDVELLNASGFGAPDVSRLCESLGRSGVRSIDQFLEQRPEFADAGKALLSRVLSTHEVAHELHDASERRWYGYLFNNFVLNSAASGWGSDPYISILTFNYDRSLDYWLLNAVMERLNKTASEARDLLKFLPVVHLHGTLGGSPLTTDTARPYGVANDPGALRACVAQLRVVHEASPTTSEWKQAHGLLSEASHVVFLGFGYDPTNVQRLGLREHCYQRDRRPGCDAEMFDILGLPKEARILGTCYDLKDSEIKHLVLPALSIAHIGDYGDSCKVDTLTWLRTNVDLLKRPS